MKTRFSACMIQRTLPIVQEPDFQCQDVYAGVGPIIFGSNSQRFE